MEGAELAEAGITKLRILVFLLYVAACAFAYWRLVPRLPGRYQRVCAFFLLAQILVTVVAFAFQSPSEWAGWLWHLDEEYNIASSLASTQLALVGGLALLGGWLARSRPRWQRLYMIALGLVFLYFATEEYFSFRGGFQSWALSYALLGALLAAMILAAARRAPRNERIWHICILAGLAITAIGATFVEELRHYKTCQSLGLLFFDRCQLYFIEETLEYLGVWLTLIAMLGLFAACAPGPSIRARLAPVALPILWILLIPLWYVFHYLEAPLTAQPASITFKSSVNWRTVHLYGYRLDLTDSALNLLLYAGARGSAQRTLGFSLHLIDQASGDSLASLNRNWDRYVVPLVGPDEHKIYRQSAALDISPAVLRNRALWVALTLWRERSDGSIVYDTAMDSDLPLLNDSQVMLGEIVIPAAAPDKPPAAPIARFANGFSLGATDLPERAKAGDTLAIPFVWSADADASEDYAQFLHFGHAGTGAWHVYDQQPLGARLPTRLWYKGLADRETWQIPLPADLAPGRYLVFTGLYRQSDKERLPAADAKGKGFVDARVPLGSLIIEV